MDILATFGLHDLEKPKAKKPVEGERLEYEAFHARDKLKVLRMTLADGTTRAPDYRHLLDVVSNGKTEVALIYNFMLVEIRGKNLHNLIKSLELRLCSHIEEYNAKYHAPLAPDDVVVESITVAAEARRR